MSQEEAPSKRPRAEASPSFFAASYQIFVRGVRPKLIVLEVLPSTTVASMLEDLRKAAGFWRGAMPALVLTWRGRTLHGDDPRPLACLGIERDATIEARWTLSDAVASACRRRDEEALKAYEQVVSSSWGLLDLAQVTHRFLEGSSGSWAQRCLALVLRTAQDRTMATGQVLLAQARISDGYASAVDACDMLCRVASHELAAVLRGPEPEHREPNTLKMLLMVAAGIMDAARMLPAYWAARQVPAEERARLDAAARDCAARHGVWRLCRPLFEEGASARALALFGECSKAELASLEGLNRAVGGSEVLTAVEGMLAQSLKEMTEGLQLLALQNLLSDKDPSPPRRLTLAWTKFLPLLVRLRRGAPRRRQSQRALADAAVGVLDALCGAFESCEHALRALRALGMRRPSAAAGTAAEVDLAGLLPAALCEHWDVLSTVSQCLVLLEGDATAPSARAGVMARTRRLVEHETLKRVLSSYDAVYSMRSHIPETMPLCWPGIVLACIPLEIKRRRIEKYFPLLELPVAEGEGAIIVINRQSNIVMQSVWQLMDEDFLDDVHDGLSVQFQGEDGHGTGVLRDWLTELSATLFNPAYGLFIPAAADLRVLHPNPAAAQVMQEPVLLDDDRSPPDPEHEFLTWFTFAGMVAGLALRLHVPLGCFLSDAFFKMMLGQEPGLPDLTQLCPDVARSCQQLLSSDAASLEAMHLHFVAVDEGMGDAVEVELVPGGANKSVTLENVDEYVGLLAKHYCCRGSSQAGATSFVQGLMSISYFTPISGARSDFQLLMRHLLAADFNSILGGSVADLDVADWRAHTDAKGFQGQGVDCFWECVGALTPAQRRQLLRFWTGLQSVPVGGFRDLPRLELIRDENPEHTLPSAHTCFRQLVLPVPRQQSATRAACAVVRQRQMHEALVQALAHGAADGFGMA